MTKKSTLNFSLSVLTAASLMAPPSVVLANDQNYPAPLTSKNSNSSPTPPEYNKGGTGGWFKNLFGRYGSSSSGNPAALEGMVTEVTETKPVIGREKTYYEVGETFEKTRKNNAMILAEAGEGKTHFAEGLKSKFPDSRVFFLDIPGLLSGENSIHELPKKLTLLFNELEKMSKNERVVLVIDEIHRITGIGQGQNSLAEQLKIPLNNKNIRVVGLTTKVEYDKYLAVDEAIIRRFQNHIFEPLTRTEILTILRNNAMEMMKEQRLDGNKIVVKPEALDLIVDRASDFVARRHAPDLQTDVLDTAKGILANAAKYGSKDVANLTSSLIHIEKSIEFLSLNLEIDPHNEALKRELGDLQQQKNVITEKLSQTNNQGANRDVRIQHIEKQIADAEAKNNFSEVIELREQLQNLQTELKNSTPNNTGRTLVIDKAVAADAISSMSGGKFDASTILGNDIERISSLKEILKKTVIGHEKAIETIQKGLQIEMAGIKKSGATQGVIVLDGMSGNGKSTLAEQTAKVLGQGFERIYMTDFSNAADVWKAIGSSAGYTGNESGGRITNAIAENPRAVIELAEFNKASDKVKDIFYNAFEHGFLEDGRGRKISVKHILFVMTMNTSAEYLAMKQGSELRLQFEVNTLAQDGLSEADVKALSESDREQRTMEQLQRNEGMSAALQGRLTANIATHALTQEEARRVAEVMIKSEYTNFLESQGIRLKVSASVIDFVAKFGYDSKFGARSMRSEIKAAIAEPLAELVMQHGSFKHGDTVSIDLKQQMNVNGLDKFEFTATKNNSELYRSQKTLEYITQKTVDKQVKSGQGQVAQETAPKQAKPLSDNVKTSENFREWLRARPRGAIRGK